MWGWEGVTGYRSGIVPKAVLRRNDCLFGHLVTRFPAMGGPPNICCLLSFWPLFQYFVCLFVGPKRNGAASLLLIAGKVGQLGMGQMPLFFLLAFFGPSSS